MNGNYSIGNESMNKWVCVCEGMYKLCKYHFKWLFKRLSFKQQRPLAWAAIIGSFLISVRGFFLRRTNVQLLGEMKVAQGCSD